MKLLTQSRLALIKRLLTASLFFSLPASNSYSLKGYDLNGGGDSISSSQYKIYGSLGGLDLADQLLGTTRNLQPGINGVIGTSVPPAATLSNDGNWYNRLHIILDTTGNTASDTLFAVSISPDSWSSVFYVKADNTIGSTLSLSDYRSYASWGSSSGVNILGLAHTTGYQVRATALQGEFTESGFGPASSTATTSSPELTFDIDISATDSESSPPYAMSLGVITQNAVSTATEKVWYDLDTNGDSGAVVYVKGVNAGLTSTSASHTITSSSVDLASGLITEGFGIRLNSTARTSGSSITSYSPFNGSNDVVGGLTASYQSLFSAATSVVGARASLLIKAKVGDITPAANDYQEVLISTAVPTF